MNFDILSRDCFILIHLHIVVLIKEHILELKLASKYSSVATNNGLIVHEFLYKRVFQLLFHANEIRFKRKSQLNIISTM